VPHPSPNQMCSASLKIVGEQILAAVGACSPPQMTFCQASPAAYQQAYAGLGSSGRSVYPAFEYKATLERRVEGVLFCDPFTNTYSAAGYCEDWLQPGAQGRSGLWSTYLPGGTCKCMPGKNAYGEPDPLTWDAGKVQCAACPLDPPTPLETLIAQYDTTEEAKACTRRLETGGNCDNLVKPALLTAKACLQTKMAEVGFTWDGSTTSLFRTRGYQAHFWDLFQKRWTKSGLAKLAIDDPSAYKSCTPPPYGVHKNHGLMDTVANPDSVQPHHTTGSAFDVSNDIIRDYKSALKVWAGKHQKDANYKERTITSEAAACGLRWGGNFNDNPHFDLGR
jgi:hypothetical protein